MKSLRIDWMITAAAFLGCTQLPPAGGEVDAVILNLSATTPAAPAPARVLTWNVKGSAAGADRNHLRTIAQVIRESAADVVLLQEIHRDTRAGGGSDQFVELLKATGMNGCFGKSLDVGGGGAYGNAILSRGPIRSAQRVELPGRGERRTLLRCHSAWGGVEVPLLTTHLAAWDRVNRRTRRAQVAAIADLFGADRHPLTILGGDFNAPLLAPELVELRGSSYLRSVLERRAPTFRRFGRSYDHLFVGSGWTVDSGAVLERGSSDHWPVAARLRPHGRAVLGAEGTAEPIG